MTCAGTRTALRNPSLSAGLALLGSLLFFATMVPLLSSHSPYESRFSDGVGAFELPLAPSREFLLGTDRLFRDHLVRLALGGRFSLLIGVFSTAIASILGGAIGVVCGYFEGSKGFRVFWLPLVILPWPLLLDVSIGVHVALEFVIALVLALSWHSRFSSWTLPFNADQLLMTVVDIGLAFPFMLLILALAATFERTSATTTLLTLGFSGWLGTARVIRAKTLEIRTRDFVWAARAIGQSTVRILYAHIWPSVRGPLSAVASVSVAQMILAESVLSYLGAGISPPTPTWGHMLYEGQDLFGVAPWLLLAPALMILLAVLAFHLIGVGLREATGAS
jgi:ABC-type dipeptide/oligopeptide/nickel transport system permease subunit